MRILLSIIVVIAAFFAIHSCSTKIVTDAPYHNITFVYGILDAADTAHYVRIQKAFLDQHKSAYDLAKIADSSFYLNLDVTVKEINPSDGSVHNTFYLDKVNMNMEGYPKDSGIFFTNPNYAYKFKQHLSPQYKYRLMIYNPQTGETDSAQTVLLSEDTTGKGNFIVPFFTYSNTPITFGAITPDPQNTFVITGYAPDSSLLMEFHLLFHWVDKNVNTGVETDVSYDWDVNNINFPAPVTPYTSGFNCTLSGTSLLGALNKALGAAPPDTKRYLDSCDILIYAGSIELYEYDMYIQRLNLGLTGSGIQPVFSNVSGPYSYGLFSSKARRYRLNVPFQSATFNMIVHSSYLANSGVQDIPAEH